MQVQLHTMLNNKFVIVSTDIVLRFWFHPLSARMCVGVYICVQVGRSRTVNVKA